MTRTFLMGDVHGHVDKLAAVLGQYGLIDSHRAWTGGSATLWLLGDFFDRGPDGIGAVDLVIRLQQEAPAAGGQVKVLLGNHDVLILSALRFPGRPSGGPRGTVDTDWVANGGLQSDLDRLTPGHIEWLINLPAMAHEGDVLLVHADAWFYTRYGRSVTEVNAAMAGLLRSDDERAWDQLLGDFSERLTFHKEPAKAAEFLRIYGGRRLVHGHTPVSYMTGDEGNRPYTYAGGLCTNVDSGLYKGNSGFLYALESPGHHYGRGLI